LLSFIWLQQHPQTKHMPVNHREDYFVTLQA